MPSTVACSECTAKADCDVELARQCAADLYRECTELEREAARGEVGETMYLCTDLREYSDSEGRTYQLATSAPSGHPIVSRKGSRKTFVLSWQDIVDMAKEAGIDED